MDREVSEISKQSLQVRPGVLGPPTVGVGRGRGRGKCYQPGPASFGNALPLQTAKRAKLGNGTVHRESQGMGQDRDTAGARPCGDGLACQLDKQQVLQGTDVRRPQPSQHGHPTGKGLSLQSR